MSRSLAISAFLLGFTSLLLQIVLTRELLTSFLGNEVSIALVLLVWLTFVALGSGPLSRWLLPRDCDDAIASRSLRGIAVGAMWALLWAPTCGGIGRFPGQVVGPWAMLGYSALSLGLLCLVLGGLFTGLCRAAAAEAHADRSAAVYSWEAVGAVAAGLAFHFLAAGRMQSWGVVSMVLGLNAAAGAAVWLRRKGWLTAIAFGALAAFGLAGAALSRPGAAVDLSPRWGGKSVVAEADSRYGNLAVVTESGQLTFYESGLPAFTTEDTEANEAAIHPALLAHPNPRRVLMVSGGLGGGLTEVLKHPVERVDYVEMDGKLVGLAEQYLPRKLKQALHDPRVHVHLQDGRRYVRRCPERYDVVLVLTPDPATTVVSRYYTREFYAQVGRVLAPGGLLCTGLSAAQARLTGPRLDLHAAIYHALEEVFPAVGVIPGERTQYLAAMNAPSLSLDPGLLTHRLHERRVQTAFVNETWLRFALGALPREVLLRSLDSAPNIPPNCDARPVAAHYWLQTWLAEVSPKAAAWFAVAARGANAAWLLVAVSLTGSLALRRHRRLPRLAASGAILGAGFLGMGAQLVLVMVYQATAGFLYHRIGLLMSLFMLGLAVGALGGRRASQWPTGRLSKALALVVAAQAASALGLPLLFAAGDLNATLLDAVFALASAWFGCLVGLSFPLAIALVTHQGDDAAGAAARLYALDLCGAALAAVLIGAVAIPALGIASTSHVLAAIALCALPPVAAAALVTVPRE